MEPTEQVSPSPSYEDENIQNYWVFGLCPSSGILEARKHDVSGNGFVSVLG
jgi:hypothetical protein